MVNRLKFKEIASGVEEWGEPFIGGGNAVKLDESPEHPSPSGESLDPPLTSTEGVGAPEAGGERERSEEQGGEKRAGSVSQSGCVRVRGNHQRAIGGVPRRQARGVVPEPPLNRLLGFWADGEGIGSLPRGNSIWLPYGYTGIFC